MSGIDVSGSRRQALRSTAERDRHARPARAAPARKPSTSTAAGILLRGTAGGSVTGITARGAQNGIGLVEASGAYMADNDLSGNSGWAVHLFRSTHNTIVRNQAVRTRRCPMPEADCGAAAVLRARGQRLQHHRRQRSHRLEHRRAADRPGAADPALGRATWSTATTPRSPRWPRSRPGAPGASPSSRTGPTARPPDSSSSGSAAGIDPRQHRDRRPAGRHRGHARRRHRPRGQRAARRPGGHPDHDAGYRAAAEPRVPDRRQHAGRRGARGSCCRA